MAHRGRFLIVLVLSKCDDIPNFITHVVEVRNMIVRPKVSLDTFLQQQETLPNHVLSAEKAQAIINMTYANPSNDVQEVVNMNKVTIRYSERTILKNQNRIYSNRDRRSI